ncbi:hypothetical protein EU245_05895 [Lentibacillus lipolyticus]|nr:hypothetical protein EU245_05895 [Lentibacillus lipolyticus]
MHSETREQEQNDQAKELRDLIDEVEGTNGKHEHQQAEEASGSGGTRQQKVDILDLPPRRDVHTGNNKGIKLKISRASLRLLSVIIVLLVLFGTAFYFWEEELLELIRHM